MKALSILLGDGLMAIGGLLALTFCFYLTMHQFWRIVSDGVTLIDVSRAVKHWKKIRRIRDQRVSHERGADGVTLADDSFVDKGLAQAACCLWDLPSGKITNAVQLLVRPIDVRSDESGNHPGEEFVMVTITREELRAMMEWLYQDWEDQCKATGDPIKP